MLSNWKRIYLFAGLCCVAGVGSCFDRKDELPQSILPTAEARELSPAVAALAGDRTLALELRFENDSAQLTREDEAALGRFLRGEANRARVYKILVWSDLRQDQTLARNLAAERGEALRSAVAGTNTRVEVVNFAQRENEGSAPAQAAVLAVME